MILVTMKWMCIILMTVILLHCNCKETHMSCPGISAYVDDICIGTTACNTNATYFTWINLNSETGIVTLEFDSFQNFCVGKNKLILQVSEMATEGTCKNTEDECDSGSFETHSTRYVVIKKNRRSDERYPSCEKSVNITFNFIYKSCYRLKIEPEYEPASCSSPKFLATNFTKEEFSKRKDPQVISSYYDRIQNHMVHTVRVDKLQASIMDFTVRKCDKCDSCKSAEALSKWKMATNGTGDYICKIGDENSNCTSVGGDTIKCITENINNHSQCLLVGLRNHPCEGNGVWDNTFNNYNKICQWNSLLETPSQLIEVKSTPADEDQSVVIILTSIFSFLGIVFFSIFLYIVRKKIGKWFHYAPSSPPSSVRTPLLSSVLLLYSRDCKPFMDLMDTFRNMLKQVMKCKVHDCFDPDLAEEVAKGGVEWLNKHVSSDDMKIVVVESECAVFRQKELFQGSKIGYQNPTWLDDIFIHGLKELSYDKRSNQYDRVFIVCVRGFTDGNSRLGVITPNTRYVIPQHLEELMTSLYRHTNLEYTEHLHVLERDIRNLEEYKKNNEDYLDDLLFRRT